MMARVAQNGRTASDYLDHDEIAGLARAIKDTGDTRAAEALDFAFRGDSRAGEIIAQTRCRVPPGATLPLLQVDPLIAVRVKQSLPNDMKEPHHG